MGTISFLQRQKVLLSVIIVYGTKKLRNLGGELSGAVKGFKDGMKDGSAPADDKAAAPAAAVSADKTTIDVEVKNKS